MRRIAGIDEAGRGPLAGPVVAAAVVLPEKFRHKHLDDSKKLTEENEILRGIATRQLKAQAGRDQTRKLILAELAKMEVKSKDLLMRIDLTHKSKKPGL